MGNKESDNKVMWYEVYHELAELLAKTNGHELYQKCFDNDKFKELHPWTKKFIDYDGHEKKFETLDPMHIFASINSSRMREKLRLERIHLYFKILGVKKSEELYPNIDFSGCPAPVTISLMAARNEKSQKEIWNVFQKIMNKSYKNYHTDYFDLTSKWYGIAIESFTLLLFWIDAKNFLPLDKNTVALLKKYNKLTKIPNTWINYQEFLTNENTYLYINLALIAWTGHIDFKNIEMKKDLENYLSKKTFNGIKSPLINLSIDKFEQDFKLIGIHLLEDYKGLTSAWYMLDNAFKVIDEKIEYDKEKDINLYGDTINITAIVGKNGTGKSTLVELLLETILYSKSQNNSKIEYLFKNDSIYKVDENSNTFKYKFDGSHYIKDEEFKEGEFFSNLLMNYSIHGLNSNNGKNRWIENIDLELITIEPKRNKGIIDINKEENKVKQRLILNLLREDISLTSEEENEKDNFSFQILTESKKKAVKLVRNNKSIQEDYSFLQKEEVIEKLRNNISLYIAKKNQEDITIESIAPHEYFSDIIIEGNIKFSDLSSGEKQKIYSINTIVDYLHKSKKENEDKAVNIILDEIELYFHPELQRTYIIDLLRAIKISGIDLNINIIFITHSPFILSDIPESKILFLDKKSDEVDPKSVPKDNGIQTFGANIHTLLSDNFFMSNGLMGEFAKNKIKKIVKQLNDHKEKKIELTIPEQENIKKVIQAIGEPFLNQKLWNMYQSLFNDTDAEEKHLNEEMARIQKKLESLKK